MKNMFRAFVIGIICATLPMPRVYAVIPDAGSIIEDFLRSVENTQAADDVPTESAADTGALSNQDLSQAPAIIKSDVLKEEIPAFEELAATDQEELILPTDDQPFWTKGKLIVTSSVVLTTGLVVGLILLLVSVGGGGSSGGGGGGSGGNPFIPPIVDLLDPDSTSKIITDNSKKTITDIPLGPHHPEPSTFLLMGLGLLIPFLKKRHS
ncbi:MAG: PEP-CTERM sorting domain-containing protein [Candidatus Omnitrophica bacterium]|nr:PEP-CTERM sorting domain-containing protein [Candidatus Omnitrophota bacterium]